MRFPSVIQIAHHYLPVKCTPQNYLYWHTQIIPFLFSQTLLGFVDGSYTSPPTHVQLCPTFTPPNNPDYLLWFENDQYVISVLLSFLIEDVYPVIISTQTSAAIWDALAKAYASPFSSRIIQLYADLHEFRQMDSFLTE